MSWNGTVRCSACGHKGHNRSGCPSRKQRYQEALAKPEGERDYYERRTIEEFELRKTRNSNRVCSYCEEKGHNRRTCGILAEHQGHVQRQQVAFRKAVLGYMQKIGLNIGALVNFSQSPDEPRTLSVATGIRWQDIDVTKAFEGIHRFVSGRPVIDMGNPGSAYWYTVSPPSDWPTGPKWNSEYRRFEDRYSLKVVSPVPVPASPPSDWLTDDSAVKHFFSDRRVWHWMEESNPASYYSCEFWNLEEKEQELEKIA